MRSKTSNLESAMAAAQRQVLLDHVISSPGATLGELAGMKGELSALAASLTVGEIRSGKASASKGGRGKSSSRSAPRSAGEVSTRTKIERAEYDAAILAIVKSSGGKVGADEIREQAGGTAEQVRTALKRLITAKRVKRSGRARATRYAAR